jgi:hypothetical protein
LEVKTQNLSLLLLLLSSQYTFAREPERRSGQLKISADGFATCYDSQTGALRGSQLVRTPVLTSPDGRYRAYAENEAMASDRRNGPECQNVSKLYVAAGGSGGFELVFTERPQETRLLSAISLVDWSRDSRFLLLNELLGQWGSDFTNYVVRTYDTLTGAMSDEGLVENALTKHMGGRCWFSVDAKGFSPTNGIVIELGPVFDEEGNLQRASCVKTAGLWLLGPETNELNSLRSDYAVRRYGKLSER